ncbi:hypothetical protein [Streptomyces yokosukanensis]|uniref:hypothetical protein n=1 Tax=Streptomyces yokosukanensis TaxID=67386 RepID=UPI00131B65BB|nr:hypothetical protein [Streptomyces yokosukanensis]
MASTVRSLKSLLPTAVSVALLTALTGCGGGSDGHALPSAKTVGDVQKFITRAGLPCTALSNDPLGAPGAPAEGFISPTYHGYSGADFKEETKADAAKWSVKEGAACGKDNSDAGGWVIYLTKDMKTFQQAYRDDVRKSVRSSESDPTLRRGTYLVGADFTVDPTASLQDNPLLQTDLRVLNCYPDLKVPSGYSVQPALVEGCVLTDYVPE